ncbi:MAG: copper resistance D family protein [Methylobacter sp.]
MYLQGIADFFDDILGGLSLIGSSLIVGSLLWRLVVLDSKLSMPGSIIRRSIWGIGTGAVILAAATALGLLVKVWTLSAMLGGFKFAAYAETIQFKASLLRFLLALALAGTAYRLLRTPRRQSVWTLAIILILALTVDGAWLVHAVGRLEHRAWLMTITVLHQFAAGAWIGGVFQLLLLRALGRHDVAVRAFWPQALTRFARLGIPAVIILIVNGLLLARNYVGNWAGLVGTAYGSLVIAKVILLGCALGFALLNNRAARRWPRTDDIERKVPYYVETEFLLLVTILFIAASLSSESPAVDSPRDTATLSEIAVMFTPRMPRLVSPSHAEFIASETDRTAFENNAQSLASAAWSDYNHNVCGLFLAAMAIAALLSYHPRLHWARYWPLGFAALGLFLFFRSDPQAWPLGPDGVLGKHPR